MFSLRFKRATGSLKFRKLARKRSRLLCQIVLFFLLVLLYIAAFEYLMIQENQPENANIITAIYWATSTITTVGYGDVVFTSQAGKVFSVLVQIVGLIMIFGFLLSYIIIPWLDRTLKFRLPVKALAEVKDHIIICGYNQLVETLIDELAEQEIQFLIVDENKELIRKLASQDIPCISGIPSDRQTLINANIDKARILIANQSDEKNANIVLTAREFDHVEIIALVEDWANSKYLRYAGANNVMSPKSMLGKYIGQKALDRLVSRVTGATEVFKGVHITEFPIYLKSSLIGKTLKEISREEVMGAKVVGMWKSGTLTFNPEEEDMITENSILLAVGTPEQLEKLKRLTF